MISSAYRTLLILEKVGQAVEPVGVTEVSRRLGLVAGTVFRGLHALEATGFVQRYQSSSRYVLGPTAAQLHHRLLSRFLLRDLSVPYLEQLAFATGEAVSLMVPIGWYGVQLVAVAGTNDVVGTSRLGQVDALERSFGGRAILAFLSPGAVDDYRNWAVRSPDDVARDDSLVSSLATARDRGFVVQRASFAPGRASIAFPVCHEDRAIAAIAIEGPAVAWEEGGKDRFEPLHAVVHELERAIRTAPVPIRNPFAHLDPADIRFGPVTPQ